MNLEGKTITLHDMSLRDGMHPQRHQLTPDQMIEVATALDEAGVPLIEVTHGDDALEVMETLGLVAFPHGEEPAKYQRIEGYSLRPTFIGDDLVGK